MKGYAYVLSFLFLSVLLAIAPELSSFWDFIVSVICGAIIGFYAIKAYQYDKLMRDRR